MVFSGYAVFTRHNAIWAKLNTDWGYSVGPWVTMGLFCLILLVLLSRNGWSFHIPPIHGVDIHNGVAVRVSDDLRERNVFQKKLLSILDKL